MERYYNGKLNKANNYGSISVIIPKPIANEVWKAKEDVGIIPVGTETVMISKSTRQQQPLEDVLETLIAGTSEHVTQYNNIEGMTAEEQLEERTRLRGSLSCFLAEVIKRI